MLFKNAQEINEYAPISQEDYYGLKPYIERIEEKYIKSAISPEQYAALIEAYKNVSADGDLNPFYQELLRRCRTVIGFRLGAAIANIKDVDVSMAGVRRSETETSKSAYQYQKKDFIRECENQAIDATEQLLQFLEDNSGRFLEYENSPARQANNALLIRSASEFNELFHTASPQYNYMAMRSIMADQQEFVIKPLLGAYYYDIYLKRITEGVQSGFEKTLLYKLKKALAALTVAAALPLVNLRLTPDGFGQSTANEKDSNTLDPASPANLSVYLATVTGIADSWLRNARQYLVDNAAEFPQWTQPTPKEKYSSTNFFRF